MKDFRDIAKNLTVLVTLLFNFFIIWILLHDPFSQILLDKNQPYYIPEPHSLIFDVTLLVIVLLIITSIMLFVKIYKKKKIFYFAPLFTLLVIVVLLIISSTALKYPSSTSGWFENGHYYKMEIWWNTPDHKRTYKRWKSVLPYDGKSNTDKIKYKLDSLSITTDD